MALLRTIVILFAVQTRALLRSKRGLICTLLAFGPAAIALVARGIARAESEAIPAFELGWMRMVQGTVPLVALILGAAVLAEEVEDRTITFLFTRPIPRVGVLLGRLLAALFVVELLLFLGAEAAFALLSDGGRPDPEMGLPAGMAAALRNTCLWGGLVYTTLFAVAGAVFKHPMIIGIAYTFVVEGFVANLPGQNPTLTIQFHLKSRLAGMSPEFAHRMRHLSEHQELLPPDEAQRTLWISVLVALALGSWVVSRKQYVLPS